MRDLFTNLILFLVLSIAFSGLTACTNTASTEKTPVGENGAPASDSSGSKKSDYPPVPSGIIKADIKDLEGNSSKLEDKKGKVVLINLWATWCGPCINEMPDLIEMQEKYKDKNFEILGLNVDNETPEEIKAFAEDKKLNYPLGYANNKFKIEMFKITRMEGIPQSILVNREGQLTGVFTGGGKGVINNMKVAVEKIVNE